MFNFYGEHYMRLLRVSLLVVPILIAAVQVEALAAPIAVNKQAPKPPVNQAHSAALIDVASGRILFSQRGDERMKIASLTKIMTAIVAIEYGDLDSQVNVSTKAAGKEGSSLFLKAGEKIALHNVLYGLMLRSGNDAAVAIAEHVGGSLDGFAYLMNKKAEEIGLVNSQFMNPHGLDEQGHYSSANDMAKLTAYAMHNDKFKEIVSTRVKSAPNPHEEWDYKWVNKNKMLTMYDGADGVKTGYTKQALRCLVSSATREGQQLVAVTLKDGDDWLDHRNLLDFGFANYPLVNVTNVGDPVTGYPYEVQASFQYPFAVGERERLKIQLVPLEEKTTTYKLGYRGQLKFVLNEQIIGRVPLGEAKGLDKPSQSTKPSSSSPTYVKPSGKLSFMASLQASIRALFLQGGLS